MRSYFSFVLCTLLGFFPSALLADQPYAGVSESGDGAIATVHPLATKAALDVLNNGGNAIDAAAAAALTLGVVDGHNSGIGGGNFAVIRFADGKLEAIDGREMAPQAAHRDMYLRDGKADGSLSTTGALAIGIPGSLKVYEYMLERGGKKSLAQVITPAANLAEQGFPIDNVSARRIDREAERIALFPATAAVLLDQQGKPLQSGATLIQKDLAKTYRGIAKQGSDYFYKGEFAKQVDEWMKANNGIVRYDDFVNYEMPLREPVVSDYRGYRIVGFPPPSSGGVHVAQILNILESFDLRGMSEVRRNHVIAEAMRIAFADRAEFLGDPDYVPVPKGLIDSGYGKELAKKIQLDKVIEAVEHGEPPGADIDLFGKHTTHIAAADKEGNWVAITTTVNTSYGSKVIIPGTGVVMNNQMDDFSLQPGVANFFGLVGSEANSVQAGKRPLSSMSPTIVMKDDKPVMTLGAAGGPTIITQVVGALINVIDLGMSVEGALAAKRIHHQWRPNVLFVESDMPEDLVKALEAKGHKTRPRGNYGATQMIRLVGDQQQRFEVASEPRVIKRNQ